MCVTSLQGLVYANQPYRGTWWFIDRWLWPDTILGGVGALDNAYSRSCAAGLQRNKQPPQTEMVDHSKRDNAPSSRVVNHIAWWFGTKFSINMLSPGSVCIVCICPLRSDSVAPKCGPCVETVKRFMPVEFSKRKIEENLHRVMARSLLCWVHLLPLAQWSEYPIAYTSGTGKIVFVGPRGIFGYSVNNNKN
jgi:hypothetical protein